MPATPPPTFFFIFCILAITGVTGVLSGKHLQNPLGPQVLLGVEVDMFYRFCHSCKHGSLDPSL